LEAGEEKGHVDQNLILEQGAKDYKNDKSMLVMRSLRTKHIACGNVLFAKKEVISLQDTTLKTYDFRAF